MIFILYKSILQINKATYDAYAAIDTSTLLASEYIPDVSGDNGKLITEIDYHIIFNNATGIGFTSWTNATSDAGNWMQVINAEGANTLLTDGSFKFYKNSGEYYNIRNKTAPSNAYLAISVTAGDAPTANSMRCEFSPDEATNSLSGNGSWKFVKNADDDYNLVNKTYNSGDNFLSYQKLEATVGTSNFYGQVVDAEDADNTKANQGSIKFTGPYNYTILKEPSNGDDSYQVEDTTTSKKYNMFALKILLDLNNISYTDYIEVGPATLVKPSKFCNSQVHYDQSLDTLYQLDNGNCTALALSDNYDYFSSKTETAATNEFCFYDTLDTCYEIYSGNMKFVQTGCGVAATLTEKYSTNKIYAGDSTCSDANSLLKLLTCNAKSTADNTDANNTKCNDVVSDFTDPTVVDNNNNNNNNNNNSDVFDYAKYEAKIDVMAGELDTLWIMVSTFLVMFMQAGFAMLEMGTVRSKNAQNILLKNLLDISFATVIWFCVGYGIAYGSGEGTFMGASNYFGSSDANYGRDWIFQWAFSGATATIVSGSVSERCYLHGYVIISVCLIGFIYPVVVHWTWAAGGWVSALGFTDFAGSGIVHMTGGFCGLYGAIFLGPRIGRFDPDTDTDEFRPHNVGLMVLGTFILWFGWYGFNGGSALGATGDNSIVIQTVCMNTTLSAAMGGLTVFILTMLVDHVECVSSLANGLLAGLVSITAGCDSANEWWALFAGLIGGVIFWSSSRLMKHLQVDDPLDAFSVHGACGLWGCIVSGLTRYFVRSAELKILTGCLLGPLIIVAWVSVCCLIMFGTLKYVGFLRVKPEIEDSGLDEVYHGGLGYYIYGSKPNSRTGEVI